MKSQAGYSVLADLRSVVCLKLSECLEIFVVVFILRMPQAQKIGVLCFAHLRWSFVFQRPQHVMTRLAAERQVIYFEEPEFGAIRPSLELSREGNVTIARPALPAGLPPDELIAAQKSLVDELQNMRWFRQPPCSGITRRWRCRLRATSTACASTTVWTNWQPSTMRRRRWKRSSASY